VKQVIRGERGRPEPLQPSACCPHRILSGCRAQASVSGAWQENLSPGFGELLPTGLQSHTKAEPPSASPQPASRTGRRRTIHPRRSRLSPFPPSAPRMPGPIKISPHRGRRPKRARARSSPCSLGPSRCSPALVAPSLAARPDPPERTPNGPFLPMADCQGPATSSGWPTQRLRMRASQGLPGPQPRRHSAPPAST